MVAYHDTEWGVPSRDERHLFEMLNLEGAQAGLSWITILRKRENYRRAFDGFDPEKMARYDEAKVASLLADAGIVRNRLKIAAAIGNARAYLAVQREWGSFDRYIWGFVGGSPGKTSGRRWRSCRADSQIRGHEQGASRARLSLYRPDDLLRLHAGDGHGERPCCSLLPARGAAGALRLRLAREGEAAMWSDGTSRAPPKGSLSRRRSALMASTRPRTYR